MQKWFYENHIVLNSRKCNYMLIGNHGKPAKINLTEQRSKVATTRNSLVYSLRKKQVLMSPKNPYVRKQGKILALLPE